MIEKIKILIYNKWMYRLLLIIFTTVTSIELSFQYITSSTKQQIYSEVEKIPNNKVGLVLGTSSLLKNGNHNPYFIYRMEAAAKLYHSGKIKVLIVSGDNHTKGYNEPQDMEDYLKRLNVPASKIIKDYAGFRTFDSVIRAKKTFGQTNFTIISQKFHNERALFICNQNNIDAIAFNAQAVISTPRNTLREYLAKFKAVLDVFILDTQPKFLGEKITIS
jgi:SanA protein